MIHLFPASSLDNSIITSVLIGVLIVWLFQETLGWNLTGLVVPGYVASILVIQPVTGAVVLAEALVTWLVFVTLSDLVPRWWLWSPLFGRDRFFGMLLTSVAVRVVLEGGGFHWLQGATGLAVDQDLHSMSLVVVPLAANAIWRTGFLAATTRIGVPVVATWAVLQLVLLRFTNLSLASFELTYENLSLDFVSSPQAYILLLTGASIGSAANARWGWDYGGIIIPGLLAVCWLEPSRLLATMVEVVFIAALFKQVVKLPALRTANLTGGRPLILAFVTGYAVKFVLAWVLGTWWPGLQVRELFGFGYLLSTMMALRVVRAGHDPFRPIVPALVTSFAGMVVGSAVGYALAVLVPAPLPPSEPTPVDDRPELALATVAWENEGEVPDLESLLRDPAAHGLFRGGQGFGGLWLRRHGEDLAMTARVGREGTPAALVALARATHARIVLLCGHEGAACDAARAQIALRWPLLEVRDGETTTLAVSGRLPEALRTVDLAGLLGPVAVTAAEDGLVLTWSDASRMSAASLGVGEDASPLDPAATLGPLPLSDGRLTPADQRVLVEEVLAPWMGWRRREPWSEDGERVATGMAATLGLELRRSGDLAVLWGQGFRLIVDRRGREAIVVSTDEARTAGVARSLFEALSATALIEDRRTELASSTWGADRSAQAALVGMLRELGPETSLTMVRAGRDTRDAGADVVLTNGVPDLRPETTGALFAPVRAAAEAAGLVVATWDGSVERAFLTDAGSVVRDVARVATGGPSQVTVYVHARARERLGGSHESSRHAALVESLPVVRIDRRGMSLAPVTEAWKPTLEAARALGASAELGDRTALRAAARRGRVVAFSDAVLGVRWVGVERCPGVGQACERLIVPLEAEAAPIVGEGLHVEPAP